MRSAITNDGPLTSDCGSDGPDPPAPSELVAAPEIELNAEATGAGSGGALAPAADGTAASDAGTSGDVRIFGALKNGAGSQGFAAVPVAATVPPVLGSPDDGVETGTAGSDCTEASALENVDETGAAAGGTAVVSADFGVGVLETEPKDCAAASPAKPGKTIPTSTAAKVRYFIGRRL